MKKQVFWRNNMKEIQRKNIKNILFSLLFLIVSICFFTFLKKCTVYFNDTNYLSDKIIELLCTFLELILLVMAVLSFGELVFSFIDFWNVKIIYRDKNRDYDFNFLLEYSNYNEIGGKKRKHAEKSFSKYEEWRSFLEERYKQQTEKATWTNFYRYLRQNLRICEQTYEIDKVVLVPYTVSVLTMYFSFTYNMFDYDKQMIQFAFFTIITSAISLLFCLKELDDAKKQVYFMQDFIEICEERAKNNKTTNYLTHQSN